MNIAFFDIQDWDRGPLKKAFPNALFEENPLTSANVQAHSDIEILSVFIHSSLTADVLAKMPALRHVVTRSMGFDHIDLDYCRHHAITVSNVPDYGSHTVAEHTFGLLLSMTRKLYQSVSQSKQLNFEHGKICGTDIYGKTLGILGLGKIGRNVARIARGFGMNIIVFTRTHDAVIAQELDLTYADLEETIQKADVLSLHLPLNDETHHILTKERIMLMKKGSYMVNTARGGLIDTEALVYGLDEGILAGVALDVLEEEEDMSDEIQLLSASSLRKTELETILYNHVLINHPNVLITPHNAFNSREALARICTETERHINACLHGAPDNLLDSESI